MKPRLVVLTGAGISAESGIPTFRDAGGLWEGHRVEDVATPQAWARNPALVLEFYNERRKRARQAVPNKGHQILADLEDRFDVVIVTQNVDNLHEKAGSTNVMHLHGSLFESRSSVDETLVYPIGDKDLELGDRCEKGSQLRPNIVWFGEMVPLIERAAQISAEADAYIVAGTSLIVYPAAGLLEYVRHEVPKFIVDPGAPSFHHSETITFFNEKASTGLEKVRSELSKLF